MKPRLVEMGMSSTELIGNHFEFTLKKIYPGWYYEFRFRAFS